MQLVTNPSPRPRLTHAQSSFTNRKNPSAHTKAHTHTYTYTTPPHLYHTTASAPHPRHSTLTFTSSHTCTTVPPTHHNTYTTTLPHKHVPHTIPTPTLTPPPLPPKHTHTHTHVSSTCVTCISYSSAPPNTITPAVCQPFKPSPPHPRTHYYRWTFMMSSQNYLELNMILINT